MSVRAQVYRFGGKVALWTGTGRMAYYDPKDAKVIAKALNAHAADVPKCKFADSALPAFRLKTGG